MSRYIDADALKDTHYNYATGELVPLAWADIDTAPSIDLTDYVPKDFHDKTCEAMAKRHQEEIANMVSVVRCKECRYKDMEICPMYRLVVAGVRKPDDFCSYGEREGE